MLTCLLSLLGDCARPCVTLLIRGWRHENISSKFLLLVVFATNLYPLLGGHAKSMSLLKSQILNPLPSPLLTQRTVDDVILNNCSHSYYHTFPYPACHTFCKAPKQFPSFPTFFFCWKLHFSPGAKLRIPTLLTISTFRVTPFI